MQKTQARAIRREKDSLRREGRFPAAADTSETAPGVRSQAGMLIAACDSCTLESGSPASILEWKSHRWKRATRSTIGSEAAAMDAAVDHAFYLSMAFSELLQPGFLATSHVDTLSLSLLSVRHYPVKP